jgi:hypothetical protein
MLGIIETTFVPAGNEPSPFKQAEFDRLVAMETPPWVLATGGGPGLTAEFPFTGDRPAAWLRATGSEDGPETALLKVNAAERHPQLGSGALLRLDLPIRVPEDGAARPAMTLNAAETTDWAEAHFLGAWCPHDEGVTFASFLPARLYTPGLLHSMIVCAAQRTEWARQFLGVDRPPR